MKHLQNITIKVLYMASLVFFYFFIFWIFSLHIEPYIIFSWFFVLFTFYYIMDLFNFEVSAYRMQDLILSFSFNFLNAVFFYLFFRAEKLFVIFFILAVLENISKFLLMKKVCRKERVIVYGYNDKLSYVKSVLINNTAYHYLGYIGETELKGEARLGGYEKLSELVNLHKADKIVVLDTGLGEKFMKKMLHLKVKGVDIKDYFAFNEELEGKIDVNSVDESWLIFSRGFNIYREDAQKRIKRIFDVLLAVLIGTVAFPIMVMTAIFVKLDSPGPIFFMQQRVGYNGKMFNIIKFRSMRTDAEKDGPKWASKDDPRLTRLGKFIRKTRLDELPQLWNILKGDMSFAGPRPERPVFVDKLEKELPFYSLRHSIQPGLTGWAQVMYPYGASVEDALHKLEYDLYYIKNQGFILDMVIFFKTLKTVLFGKGR